MEHLKSKVHILTNHMQAVMGYLELEQYAKALNEVKSAIKELRELAKMIAGVKPSDAALNLPKKSVVVVPPGTAVVTADKVTTPIPKNMIAIVPKSELKKE